MLWTVLVVLLILWILGFSFQVAGNLIHLLLVVASSCWCCNYSRGEGSPERQQTRGVILKANFRFFDPSS